MISVDEEAIRNGLGPPLWGIEPQRKPEPVASNQWTSYWLPTDYGVGFVFIEYKPSFGWHTGFRPTGTGMDSDFIVFPADSAIRPRRGNGVLADGVLGDVSERGTNSLEDCAKWILATEDHPVRQDIKDAIKKWLHPDGDNPFARALDRYLAERKG